MATEIIPRTQADELNEVDLCLIKAKALVDVLSEMSAPGGDLAAGAGALEQLDEGSLNTTLSVLNDILIEAAEFMQAAWDAPHLLSSRAASRKEVPNVQA
jgi:hypothetical protein